MSSESIPPGDPLEQFKANQRATWAHFGPTAAFTTPAAADLVRFAGIDAGQCVLDVACGTGVVAVTAARLGALATGADLTPELLEQARENAGIAGVEVEWREADVEQLPFPDSCFDVVLSQFGHIFAPRPALAVAEMLRVLRPGGTIAFSTWPPDEFVGRRFALTALYAPAPAVDVEPPGRWGDPAVVRERLGAAVRDLEFERGMMTIGALSPRHFRHESERASVSVLRLVQQLEAADPGKLAKYRREFEDLAAEYFDSNTVRQSFLMSRAVKV